MRIRVFTDGGGFKKPDKKFIAVSSYIFYKNDECVIGEGIIFENKTNNFAEIYAIYEALKVINNYLKINKIKTYNIEVYTDSLLCLKSLTIWIYNWQKKSIDGILYTSVGTEVANQEIIIKAFRILKKLKNTHIYHINSHKPKNKLPEQYNHFKKFNNCDISYEDFLFAYLNNKKCDKSVKDSYKKYKTTQMETNL